MIEIAGISVNTGGRTCIIIIFQFLPSCFLVNLTTQESSKTNSNHYTRTHEKTTSNGRLIRCAVHNRFDLSGVLGPIGATGLQGRTGIKGDTGYSGAAGFPGPTGATGGIGRPGLTGASGQNGATGLPGPSGSNGRTGATGKQWLTMRHWALQWALIPSRISH